MWKLFRGRSGVHDRLDSLDKIVEDLATCCSNAHDGIRNLDTRAKTLDADISLMWEKTNRALQRFAKRESRDSEQVSQPGPRTSAEEISRRILDGEPLG